MAADPARVGNKLAAVGDGFAARGRHWWRSSWVMTLLQDTLFIFSFWKDKAFFVGRMWPSVPAALNFQASRDLGEKAKN